MIRFFEGIAQWYYCVSNTENIANRKLFFLFCIFYTLFNQTGEDNVVDKYEQKWCYIIHYHYINAWQKKHFGFVVVSFHMKKKILWIICHTSACYYF